MPSNQNLSCGKDLRKFLYVIGFISVLILIGSYWYVEYYLKGMGFGIDSAVSEVAQPAAGVIQPVAAPSGRPVAAPFRRPVASRSPFTAVAGALKNSVVNISTTRSASAPGVGGVDMRKGADRALRFAEPFSGAGVDSIGSGIIVSGDGYIITNYHVVENAKNVYVNVFGPQGSKRYNGEIVRLGESVDLALLKITPDASLVPAALGDSERLAVGDQVLAIGSPFGLDQTVSQGIVSSMRKSMMIEGVTHRNLIQTDAAINQGNSGGPLVDMDGYIIGINTAIYTPTGAFAGVGFAVPVNAAKDFIEESVTLPRVKPNVREAFFGRRGGFINAAAKIAPAIQAGARMPHSYVGPCESCHTIIPSGNGRGGTPSAGGNRFAVGPGGAVGLNAAVTTVALQRRAGGTANLWLGAEVQPIDQAIARNFRSPFTYGLFVNSVYSASPSERAGLKSGDIIFKIDGRWVHSLKDLTGRLASYSSGDEIRLSIVRSGGKQDLYISADLTPGNVKPALQPLYLEGQKAGNPVMLNQAMNAPLLAIPPALAAIIPKEFEWLGLEFDPINRAVVGERPSLSGKTGALVVEVSPGTQGAMAGVQAGDIILSVNRTPVGSARALNDAINSADVRNGILLEIERGGKQMYTVMQ